MSAVNLARRVLRTRCPRELTREIQMRATSKQRRILTEYSGWEKETSNLSQYVCVCVYVFLEVSQNRNTVVILKLKSCLILKTITG